MAERDRGWWMLVVAAVLSLLLVAVSEARNAGTTGIVGQDQPTSAALGPAGPVGPVLGAVGSLRPKALTPKTGSQGRHRGTLETAAGSRGY